MMVERKYNRYERRIMRKLYQCKASLTAYEVAKECSMSFETARKYCKILVVETILEFKPTDKESKSKGEYVFNFSLFDSPANIIS